MFPITISTMCYPGIMVSLVRNGKLTKGVNNLMCIVVVQVNNKRRESRLVFHLSDYTGYTSGYLLKRRVKGILCTGHLIVCYVCPGIGALRF